MKRILAVVICISCFLCSCSKASIRSEYVSDESFIDSAYSFDDEIIGLVFTKNLAFLRTQTSVIRLNMVNGERSALDISAKAIGADVSRLFAICDKKLNIYTHSGEIISSYDLDLEIESGNIYAEDDFLLIESEIQTWYGLQSELFSFDLTSKEFKCIEDWKQGSDYGRIKYLQINDGTAHIVYAYSINAYLGLSEYKAIDLEIKTNKILSETVFHNNISPYYDYADDSFFNHEVTIQNGKKSTVMKYNLDGTSEVAVHIPKELYAGCEWGNSFIANVIYKSGDSFALWDSNNQVLLTVTPQANNKIIRIIAPEGLNFDFETHGMQFTEKTGISVKVVKYPQDKYGDILITKILADDSNFDLFVVTNDADLLLESILDKEAYQPISGISFDALYDGIKGMMTSEHDGIETIFGVPISFDIFNAMEKCEDYDIPSTMSYREMFDLCKTLPDGYALMQDPYAAVRLVMDFVQESHRVKKGINSDELEELLTEILASYESGKLFATDLEGNQIAKPILKNTYGYFYSMVTNATAPVNYKIVRIPTCSDTTYIDLRACIMMNLNSQNYDIATQYLADIISEETVYNNDLNFANMFGRDVEKNSVYSDLSEDSRERLSYVPMLLKSAKPYTIKANELTEFIREYVVSPMLAGDISVEDAADLISRQVKYMIYE